MKNKAHGGILIPSQFRELKNNYKKGEKMEIAITGRNLNLNDSIKKYINKKISKVERMYKRIYKCEVVLEEIKSMTNVEIIVYLKSNKLIARESTPDVYASIDNATGKINKQLRRLNGKLSSKRRKRVLDKFVRSIPFVKDDKIDYIVKEGKIISTDMFAEKPMIPEEAKLELRISEKSFSMFKNADTGEVNVMYKKKNGNFGLIEPRF